jgi:hypothetical protein
MIARYQKSDKIRGTLLVADIQCPLTKVKAKSFRKIYLACVEGKVSDWKKIITKVSSYRFDLYAALTFV